MRAVEIFDPERSALRRCSALATPLSPVSGRATREAEAVVGLLHGYGTEDA
jgi:hypothetical protein